MKCIRISKVNKSRQAKCFAYGIKHKILPRGLAKRDRVKNAEFWLKVKPTEFKNLTTESDRLNILAYKVIETLRSPNKPYLWATYENLVLLN